MMYGQMVTTDHTVLCDTVTAVKAISMLHHSLFIAMYHITQIITMVFPVLPY